MATERSEELKDEFGKALCRVIFVALAWLLFTLKDSMETWRILIIVPVLLIGMLITSWGGWGKWE